MIDRAFDTEVCIQGKVGGVRRVEGYVGWRGTWGKRDKKGTNGKGQSYLV